MLEWSQDVNCPHCGAEIEYDEWEEGSSKFLCHECGETFIVHVLKTFSFATERSPQK